MPKNTKTQEQDDRLRKSIRRIKREKEKTLVEARKLHAILHNIGEGVFVVGIDRKITVFNPVAEKILKIRSSQAIGKEFDEVFRIAGVKKGSKKSLISETLATGRVHKSSGDTRVVRNNAESIDIDFSVSPTKNIKNEVTECVVVFRDVRKARAIDKAKSEFVSLASHQLRTPLSSIKWNVEMLFESKSEFTKNNLKYLNRVYKGNERMIQLVNALLNVSRLELGTFFINPKDTSLKSIIKVVINEVEEVRIKKKLRIVIKHNIDIKKMKLDENLTRIVFQNLISNAVKYTPENGRIEVRSRQDRSFVHVTISDNGYGIPKHQQSMIFTKFHRADNARELGIEGTGLGLYIIKAILDASGGKISFKSEIGKGSDFTVSIPIRGMKKRIGKKTLI